MVTNRSSPTSWTAAADVVGERGPAVPVLLGHAVLDRHDRVAVARGRPRKPTISVGRQRRGPRRPACRCRRRRTRWRPRRGRWRCRRPGVKPACSMASTSSCTASSLEREVGREAALVADGGGQAAVVEHLLEHVVGLGAPPQRLGEAGRADRHDHELLEVDVVVGVGAAVEDVHHRHRQHVGVGAADVAVQRQAELVGRGLGHGQRHAEDGVGAEAGLVVGAVEVDQLACRRSRWSRASRPRSASRISPLTWPTALVTPLPP